jgi:acyl carrier protein
MKEKVMAILMEVRPDVDFSKENALIDDGILDSFDIVTLVGEFGEFFDVRIMVEDLKPENFNNVDAIVNLITSLSEE